MAGALQLASTAVTVLTAWAGLVLFRHETWWFLASWSALLLSPGTIVASFAAYLLPVVKELAFHRVGFKDAALSPASWLRNVFFQRSAMMAAFCVTAGVASGAVIVYAQVRPPPRWNALVSAFVHGPNDDFKQFRDTAEKEVRPIAPEAADEFAAVATVFTEARRVNAGRPIQEPLVELRSRLESVVRERVPTPLRELASAELYALSGDHLNASRGFATLSASHSLLATSLVTDWAQFRAAMILLAQRRYPEAADAFSRLGETAAKYANLSLAWILAEKYEDGLRAAAKGLDFVRGRNASGATNDDYLNLLTNHCFAAIVLERVDALGDCGTARGLNVKDANLWVNETLAKVVAGSPSEARNLIVRAPQSDCVELVRYFVQQLDGEAAELGEVRKLFRTPEKELDRRVMAKACEQMDAICGPGTSAVASLRDFYCGPRAGRMTVSTGEVNDVAVSTANTPGGPAPPP